MLQDLKSCLYRTLSVVPVAQTFGDVCETKPYDTEDISRLVTVTVKEDQINTMICSLGVFIWQYNQGGPAKVGAHKSFLFTDGSLMC